VSRSAGGAAGGDRHGKRQAGDYQSSHGLGVLTLKNNKMQTGTIACLSEKRDLSYAELDERSLRSLAEHVLTRKCRLVREPLRESFAAPTRVGRMLGHLRWLRYNAATRWV
jgi:hypothetical protein